MGAADIDPTDEAILALLAADARRSWQSIGREVHLTGQAVAARVQRLLESGTIERFALERGFRERHHVTVFMESGAFAAFEHLLATHSEVVAADKVAGEGCYQIEFAADRDGALEEFLDQVSGFGRYKVLRALRRVR